MRYHAPHMRARIAVTAVVVLLIAVMTMVYGTYQRRIMAGDGLGWDGKSYFALYSRFRGDQTAPVQYPFCKRTALPYLASLLPLDASRSFLSINLAAGVLAILTTYAALVLRFRPVTAGLAVAPLIFGLFSPIRFPFFYPFYVDPPAMFLYGVTAVGLMTNRMMVAVMALALSGFFRESAVYYVAALIGTLWFLNRISRRDAALMGAAGAAGLALQLWAQAEPCDGNQIALVAENLFGRHGKLDHFGGVLRIAAGFSMTLGPFWPLTRGVVDWGRDDRMAVPLVFLLLSALVAAIGGSDTTRLLFVAYPLYVPVLAAFIGRANTGKVVLLLLAGLTANSFAKRIPEPAAYAPNHDVTGFFAFFPDYAHLGVAASLLVYWMLVASVANGIPWTRAATTLQQFRARLGSANRQSRID